MAGADALTRAGYDVHQVCSGAEAILAAAEDIGIALILMDIDLGDGCDGGETARRIVHERDVPVIFYTSHSSQASLDKLRGVPNYGCVLKSAGDQILLHSVQTALELADAKARLTERERSYRAIFENSPIGLFRSTFSGQFIDVNPTLARLLGYRSPEEVMESVTDIASQVYVNPEERQPIIQFVNSGRQQEQFRLWYRRRHGEPWLGQLDLRAVRNNAVNTPYLEGFVQDITERFRAEEAIRASEHALGAILENLPQGVFVHDLDGRIMMVNRAACILTGYSRQELLTLTISDIDHASVTRQDREQIWQRDRPGTSEIITSTHRRKDGTEYPVEVGITAATLDGKPRVIGVATDISARVDAETALRESEQQFRRLFEQAPVPYQSLDPEGIILRVNRRWLEKLGYGEEEVLGRWFGSFLAEDTQELFRECFEQFKRSGSVEDVHFTLIKKDGSRIVTSFTGTSAVGDQGAFAHSHCIFVDVTEQELLLKEVHHRIKNDMAVIKSLLSLQRGASGDATVSAALREAQTRVEIMQGIYQRLYQKGDFRTVDLASVVHDLLTQVRRTYQTGTDVRLDHDLQQITISTRLAFPLGVVINELVTNAFKYAFGDRTRGAIRVSLRHQDDWILAVVEDDGRGMPHEVLTGHSLGFGLTLVSGLVGQYGGALLFESDGGTRASIRFPVESL